jgi:hypothetical protein|tara:strand:+ start:354 stop:620 length:267 start_codon:yes stop_codon:yes gene_type:complete
MFANSANLLSASTAGPSDNKNNGDSAPNSNCLDSSDVDAGLPTMASDTVGGKAAIRVSVVETDRSGPAVAPTGVSGLVIADKVRVGDV